MNQYQTAIVRLHGKVREDEEAMTDLLNERTRMGWTYHSATALQPKLLLVVFSGEI